MTKGDDVNWDQASSFEQWIVRMIEEGRIDDLGFQAALAYRGRARIEEIWKKYKASKKPKGMGAETT